MASASSDGEWVVDEDAMSRYQINQQLDLTPGQRLRKLEGAYPLFVIGQRGLGRAVFSS